MAFTYDDDPANNNIDHVRLLVSDTDSDNPLLTDNEIQFFIDNQGNNIQAAIRAAETIAAQFARKADDVSSEEVRIRFQNRASRYWTLADKLETRSSKDDMGALGSKGTMIDKDTVDDDPLFELEQFDNNENF